MVYKKPVKKCTGNCMSMTIIIYPKYKLVFFLFQKDEVVKVIYCLWKEMCVHSLIKHYTAIEYVTSEGQYHTKLERYCTTFSVSP